MNRLNEVVFPVSRAVIDDESDEENENHLKILPEPVFRWNRRHVGDGGKLSCKCLVVALGHVATGFIDSVFCLDEREMVCSSCSGGSNVGCSSWSQTAPSDSSSFLWRRKGKREVAICQCRETVASHQAFSWVQQLFSVIEPSTVIILDSRGIGELKSASQLLSDGDYFPLLSLRSSSLTAQPCCPFLQPPNTVGGLCAEVLTYCEVKHLPAMLYVAYTSDSDPLTQLIAAFTPVLSCSILQPYIQDVSQQLAVEHKKLESFLKSTGSLYL